MSKQIPLTIRPHELAAALAGTLRQIRRPVVPQPVVVSSGDIVFPWATFCFNGHVHTWDRNGVGGQNWDAKYHPEENQFEEALRRTPYKNACPLGQPGDVLYSVEPWKMCHDGSYVPGIEFMDGTQVYPEFCQLDSLPKDWPDNRKRRPKSLPRWASRWARNVAAVRVERVQDIDEWGCYACGIDRRKSVNPNPAAAYRREWNCNYARKGYLFDDNPWVWVAEIESI